MNTNVWASAAIGYLITGTMTFAVAAPDGWAALRHTVAAGDTLEELAVRYTGSRANWQRLQAINHVAEPRHLQPGKVILIPPELRSPAPAMAKVAYVHGQASAVLPGASGATPLVAGEDLPEQTRIIVAENGYARIVFADGSTSELPEGTQAVLERMRRQPATGVDQTNIRLESGRADSSVTPLRKPQSQFRIRTPLAVASVRGTRFGVEVQSKANAATSEVLEGRVQVASTASSRLLTPGKGTRVSTDGQVAAPVALPAAPDLAVLPATFTDADAIILPLPQPPLPGVVSYRVRIAPSADASAIVIDKKVPAISGSTATLPAQPDGDYTITMRAIDKLGLQGPQTERAIHIKAHPLPPLFQSPTPKQKVKGDQVTLRCVMPETASRIRLQIATSPAFDAPLVNETNVQGCTYTATLPPGTYYWRLATTEQRDGQAVDEGPYSRPQAFDLAPLPPVPEKPDVSNAPDRLEAHWSGLPGLHYRVQLAPDSAFARPVFDQVITGSEVTVPDLAPGQYFLRMQAIDAEGTAGAFSPAWRAQVGSNWLTSAGQPLTSGDAPVLQNPGP